jgi:trimeric autotransporter adhesin
MRLRVGLVVAFLSFVVSLVAQTSGSSSPASVSVPPVIQFSNVATDPAGGPLTGTVPMTFSLYNSTQGGDGLWTETQSVTLDSSGHYSVYLGITKANGLPIALFASGQALWLGVQVAGEAEQPRIALVSVPYAIEAGNAATIGGLPPSAFVKANSTSSGQTAGKNANPATETQNYIPLFVNGSGGLGNSILYQSGTTQVGIGTTTPSATLEVNGTSKFDGLVSFSASQTFPGTLTGITAGTGLTATGSKTNPTLSVDVPFANQYYAQLKAANTFTGNQTVTGSVSATAGFLIGGNLIAFGSYGNANSFLGFAGNTTTTGIQNNASGTGALALNTTGSANAAIGADALNHNTTGSWNTADGASALVANTTGTGNTANGLQALNTNTTGAYNSAIGVYAGQTADKSNLTANNNTALGAGAEFSTGSLTNATAIGSNAQVAESNALVLGAITGVNSGTSVNVGIGTTTPAYTLDVHGTGNFTGTVTFAGSNTFTGNQAISGNLSATGMVTGNSFGIGSNLFAFGTYANGNAFLGFAGNSASTGNSNTASGLSALASVTGGSDNTASGVYALQRNTAGNGNTAAGWYSLDTNTTGAYNSAIGIFAGQTLDKSNLTANNNTALGAGAAFSTGTLTNATAIGSNSEVAESNALVLGSVSGVNGATASVYVGIGTTQPQGPLEVVASNMVPAITGTGYSAPSGSENSGGAGVYGLGGTGDPEGQFFSGDGGDFDGAGTGKDLGGHGVYANGGSATNVGGAGGAGVVGYGGNGSGQTGADGNGATFYGGGASSYGDGVDANAGSGYAGNFQGSILVTGGCSGCSDIYIDHPVDPANKYFHQGAVTSSEMMNIYSGNVTTDAQGVATVHLPDWFEVINTDFRYQLTVIGQFAQAIIGRKIENHQFTIRTSAPNVEVSWQVTGVRQDAYAKAHPLVVEQEKEARLQGFYIHPELYGAPAEKQIEWARHPQMMKKLQQMKQKQAAQIAQPVSQANAVQGSLKTNVRTDPPPPSLSTAR